MTIVQASFFWQNDKPEGLGFTFGPPSFTPAEITEMFDGENARQYMRDSDMALGSNLVADYLAQLQAIARVAKPKITMEQAILAALNIMWLSNRGFIPNDEFNGVQLVKEL